MCEDLAEKLVNGKWSSKDRMYQLKGLLDLDERNRKWDEKEMKEIAKKRSKEIKELASTEQDVREAVHKIVMEGDLDGINVLLKQDPTLETLCKGKSFHDCEEIVTQLIFLKRKELDSLVYDLQQKEEEFLQNQYKMEMMKTPAKLSVQNPDHASRAQEIEAEIENIITRQEAAVVVRDSYDKIRKILKKDSRCFDTILRSLQLDTIVQCQCVVKAMELGQAAIEDEAKNKEKYVKMNKEFMDLVQSRDQKITEIKRKINKAKNAHNKLFRSESLTKLLTGGGTYGIKHTADMYTNKLVLENRALEDTLSKLKELFQVTSSMDIPMRAEKTEEKKHRLQRQIDINNMWVKAELIRKNHINSMNEKLLHCLTEEAKQWMAERKRLEAEWGELLKEYKDLKSDKAQEARVLADIQMQVTHIQRVVEPIKVGAFQIEKLDANLQTMERRIQRIGDEGAWIDESSALNFMEVALKPDDSDSIGYTDEPRPAALMDICQLLDVISAKVDIIKTQVGETDHKSSYASNYYKEYMSNRAQFYQESMPVYEGEKEEEGGAVKDKIPTREEMKERSKRLVAAYKEKPRAPTGPAVFTVRKHSCY